jgi:hypothetical protein
MVSGSPGHFSMRFLKKTPKDLPSPPPEAGGSFSLFKSKPAAAPADLADVVDMPAESAAGVGATRGEAAPDTGASLGAAFGFNLTKKAQAASAAPSAQESAPKTTSSADLFFSRFTSRMREGAGLVLRVEEGGASQDWLLEPAAARLVSAPQAQLPSAVLGAGDCAVELAAGEPQAAARSALPAALSATHEAWSAQGKHGGGAVFAATALGQVQDLRSAAAAAAATLRASGLEPRAGERVAVSLGGADGGLRLVFEALGPRALRFLRAQDGPGGADEPLLDSALFLRALQDAPRFKPCAAAAAAPARWLGAVSLLLMLGAALALVYGAFGARQAHGQLSQAHQQLAQAQQALADAQAQAQARYQAQQATMQAHARARALLAEPWRTPLADLARLWMPSALVEYDLSRAQASYTLRIALPLPHRAAQVPQERLLADLLAGAAPAGCTSLINPVESTSREAIIVVGCRNPVGRPGGL